MRTGKNGFRRITAMLCALALCASMMPTAVFAVGDQDAGTGTDISTSASQSDENSAPDSGDTLPEDTNKTEDENSNGSGVDSTTTEDDGEKATTGTEGTGDNEAAGSGDENGTVVTDEEKKPADTSDEDNNAGLAATYSANGPAAAPSARSANIIYENDEKGIYITYTKDSGYIERTVNFVITENGTPLYEVTLDGFKIAGNSVTIIAPRYKISTSVDNAGGTFTHDDVGNDYRLIPTHDNITARIELESFKTHDDVPIVDQESGTNYGTFSWLKGSASNDDYERILTVVVDGKAVYEQNVYTPNELRNVLGQPDQYWFTPSSDYKYDCELDPSDWIDSISRKNLTVKLTSKCPCGNPWCTCPGGGCECTEGCPCEYCAKTDEDRVIQTQYGTISYKEPSAEGYNLTVETYVNGTLVDTQENLRIRAGDINCLNFEPVSGYYYYNAQNSYDIVTLISGGSWTQETGYIYIPIGEDKEKWEAVRNYDNVLKVYLWTFSNHLTLDVNRAVGDPLNHVTGYMISFEAPDPQNPTTTKTYTYKATSFEGAQQQMIPFATEVTVTPICDKGYEVEQWSTGMVYSGVTLRGSEGQEGTEAYGNSAVLYTDKTALDSIVLKIDSVRTVTRPTEEDLVSNTDDIFGTGNSAVIVDCLNTDANHADQTYGLEADTFTISDLQGDSVNGYYVTVTITDPDAYVTDYNQVFTDVTHERADSNTKTIRLNWEVVEKNGVKESQWKAEKAATIEVTCKDTTPNKPDDDTIKELLEQAVLVKCTNDSNTHTNKSYGALEGGYSVGDLRGDAISGYRVDVTISCGTYVTQYSTDTNSEHVLESGETTEKTITLKYDLDKGQWEKPAQQTVIKVTCKADIIVTPEKLTIYRGGEKTEENGSNYNIVDENGDPMKNTGSLPEIGFSLQLSTELNERLHHELNVPMDQALDLAGRITLTAKTSDGKTTLEWELKHYGSKEGSSVTTTGENGFYIYKIVPVGDTEGAKLNVSFINNKGKYVNTDAFEIEDDNKLAATYKMMIYGDRVDASTLSATIKYGEGKTETASVQGAEDPATLTVRYTNTDASITHSFDTVAEASKDDDGNPQSQLTDSAYMIRKDENGKPVDNFMVNNSEVQVDGQDVSLLFDDIAETTDTNYADTLKTKAVDAVKEKNADVDTSKLKTEAKYLDLVDATNGNVWVTTGNKQVTIYWPFPEGTDASTTFYVAHFDGLDRDKDVSGMNTAVDEATASMMNVETDQYGVYFTTSSFSPYVLVWDTTTTSGGGGSHGGGDGGTTNNNNNTNNNTTTVNVTSTAAAQPQAAPAAIPQTGDAMPVGLLGGLAAAAAAGFAALFVIRKRKQNG